MQWYNMFERDFVSSYVR